MTSRILHSIFGLALMMFALHSHADDATIRFRHIVVLGDSLSDQGNLLAATTVLGPQFNQPPIPSPDHYFDGRFSNGENYVGILARKLGVKLAPSQLGGDNYAFGGARTNYNRVEFRAGVPPPLPNGVYPVGAYPWSLDGEREAFLANARRVADPNSLYIVFSGANDLSDALIAFAVFHQDPTPAIARAVQGIHDVIGAFQTAGARTVLVPNLPNLGVVPSVTQNGAAFAGLATRLTLQYNAALDAMLATITGVNIVEFNTFAFTTDVVAHPADYGFVNVTQPCFSGYVAPDPTGTVCANPDQYVFWDVEHPTTRLHELLADAIYQSVLDCESVQGARNQSSSDRSSSRCSLNVP